MIDVYNPDHVVEKESFAGIDKSASPFLFRQNLTNVTHFFIIKYILL